MFPNLRIHRLAIFFLWSLKNIVAMWCYKRKSSLFRHWLIAIGRPSAKVFPKGLLGGINAAPPMLTLLKWQTNRQQTSVHSQNPSATNGSQNKDQNQKPKCFQSQLSPCPTLGGRPTNEDPPCRSSQMSKDKGPRLCTPGGLTKIWPVPRGDFKTNGAQRAAKVPIVSGRSCWKRLTQRQKQKLPATYKRRLPKS